MKYVLFSLKNDKKMRMLSATILLSTLRVNSFLLTLSVLDSNIV